MLGAMRPGLVRLKAKSMSENDEADLASVSDEFYSPDADFLWGQIKVAMTLTRTGGWWGGISPH